LPKGYEALVSFYLLSSENAACYLLLLVCSYSLLLAVGNVGLGLEWLGIDVAFCDLCIDPGPGFSLSTKMLVLCISLLAVIALT